MAENRTGHPYHMYDAIQAQPETWTRVVARVRDGARSLAELMAGTARFYLVGTGTSFHAAQAGEGLLSKYGGPGEYRAVPSFDFALYTPPLSPADAVLVVSHRGYKTYSVKSLEIAHAVGCRTVLITGEGPHAVPKPGLTDYVFVGAPQEISSAHTVSYVASVAILATLAQQLAIVRHGPEQLTDQFLDETVRQALTHALQTESQVAQLARQFAGRRRLWIIGGGPASFVATETALKIRETSYLQAEGIATETMLHGPFQAVEAEDLFVLIAPQGPAQARTLELSRIIREIGAPLVVVSDSPRDELISRDWILVPHLPEPFVPLTSLMPMQLFAYHLALARRANPDIFRADDERFARASSQIKL